MAILPSFDGLSAGASSDIQVLFDGLPDPIDRDLDRTTRPMYWTDRGDPPRGNTVNRARMHSAPGRRKDPEIVFTHLMEGIGLALDIKNQRMFMSDSRRRRLRCDSEVRWMIPLRPEESFRHVAHARPLP